MWLPAQCKNLEIGAATAPGEKHVLTYTSWIKASIALLLSCWLLPVSAAPDIQQVIRFSCSGCHAPMEDGRWTRISNQRKTPEGWQMTLARMQLVHKAQFLDPAGGDSNATLRALVKYFADEQGLAPQESEPYRYILEQELNTVEEHPTEEFRSMCARCHSGARVALQRRTEDEWRNLVHFHLGQFPTAEYQMMGRDRDWLNIALDNVVPYLSEHYPLETAAWTQWRSAARPELSGRWRLVGTMPGRGEFSGTMVATRKAAGDDLYTVQLTGQFLDGDSFSGSGSAVVYTGYEWRASIKVDGRSYRQVLAATADGTAMRGRMFDRDHSEWGLRLNARRDSGAPAVLAVQPAHIRAGDRAQLLIVGSHLDGSVDVGPGLRVVEVLDSGADHVRVLVEAAKTAATGQRTVAVGGTALKNALLVYDRVDRLSVEPAFAIARVGDNGGSQPVVDAMFDAVAWSPGADGQSGTDDDLRIGTVPAQWSVEPFDEQAVKDKDVQFAGRMDKDSGVFRPAAAGPNPQRKYHTNNAGNLRVIATVPEGAGSLRGDAHLIVTVQRWNNPPIR